MKKQKINLRRFTGFKPRAMEDELIKSPSLHANFLDNVNTHNSMKFVPVNFLHKDSFILDGGGENFIYYDGEKRKAYKINKEAVSVAFKSFIKDRINNNGER